MNVIRKKWVSLQAKTCQTGTHGTGRVVLFFLNEARDIYHTIMRRADHDDGLHEA